MKKLLIVDTTGKIKSLKESIRGTEVAIIKDTCNLLELLKSTYNFDTCTFQKINGDGPARLAAGLSYALRRRRAEIESRTPYWDALLFFLKGDSALPAAIGASWIASVSGCRYIDIRVVGDDGFGWLPVEVGCNNSFFSSYAHFSVKNVTEVRQVSPKESALEIDWTNWKTELQKVILRKEGYQSCILQSGRLVPADGSKKRKTADELFEEVWPGFPWEKSLVGDGYPP